MWSILIALISLDAITIRCGMFQLNQMDAIQCGPFCFFTMRSILIALISLDAMQCGPFRSDSIQFNSIQCGATSCLVLIAFVFVAV